MFHHFTTAVAVLCLIACGDDDPAVRDTSAETTTDTTAETTTDTSGDSAAEATAETTTDTSGDSAAEAIDTTEPTDTSTDTVAPLPNISEALDCGAGPGDGPGNAQELQRHFLDLERFPDALCNDGSNAVFFFRPYVGEENKDRWLINLNGGGGCGSGQSCADRWCWCRDTEGPNGCPFAGATTNFSMSNMVTDSRGSIDDGGIFLRGDAARPNPMGNWNHVRVVYCSSDAWAGTRRDSPLDAVHPKTGEAVRYAIHFLGARIIDATLATLRRDGVPALDYTFGAGGQLPDLDDATQVVLSGDSAGGSGVITQLDRVRDTLRAHNTKCGGATCPLVVSGLMDAIVGPELARLEFETTKFFELGITNYDLFTQYVASVPDMAHGALQDESCLAWHAANQPGTESYCSDNTHIVRHHITTPFFVRMALLDVLISGNYVETGWSDPTLGLFDVRVFGRVLQSELLAFPDLPTTAEEGDAMPKAPGVFAPACARHDTIHYDGEVYGTTITPEGGAPLTLFDVLTNWALGRAPEAVLTMTPDRADTTCGQ